MKPDQVLVVEDNGACPVRLPWFGGKFDTLLFPQV